MMDNFNNTDKNDKEVDAMDIVEAGRDPAGSYEQRKIGRTDVNGFKVSTAYSSDEGYETALIDTKGVHVVERYDSEDDAQEGHDKWIVKASKLETGDTVRGLGHSHKEARKVTVEKMDESGEWA